MAVIPLADNFQAGAVLTLLMPVALLIAITVWYLVTVRRFPGQRAEQPPAGTPTPEAPQAAATTEAEQPGNAS
jgi:hypothetical protein